jgi:hypothetical protein
VEITTVLPLGAPIMALGLFALGVGAIARPSPMSHQFGISAIWPQSGFIVGLGVRDIFVGAVLLKAWFDQDWGSLALWSFLLSPVALADFIVVQRSGNTKASYIHLLGALACASYGLLILGFLAG